MRRFTLTLAAAALLAGGPSFSAADDQQIAQAIVQNLREHQEAGRLKGFDIDLNVEDGRVTLTGNVVDVQQHKLTIDAARFVPGVKMVVNDLKIDGAQAEHPDQQKSLGSGLAAFFGRGRQTAEPQNAPHSQGAQRRLTTPQAAPHSTNGAPPAPPTSDQAPKGLLAGLRSAWAPQEPQSDQQAASPSEAEQITPQQPTRLVERPPVSLFSMPHPEPQPSAQSPQPQAQAMPPQLPVQSAAPPAPAARTQVSQAAQAASPSQASQTPQSSRPAQPQGEPSQVAWQPPMSAFAPPQRSRSMMGDFDPTPGVPQFGVTADPTSPTNAWLPFNSIAASNASASSETQQPPRVERALHPSQETLATSEEMRQPAALANAPLPQPVAAQPAAETLPKETAAAQAAHTSTVAAAPPAAPQAVAPAANESSPAAAQAQRAAPQIRVIPIPIAVQPRCQAPMAHAASSLPGSPSQPPRQQQGVHPAMMMGPHGPVHLAQATHPLPAQPMPQFIQGTGGGVIPARYDHPHMPGYAWPSYASYPNYAALQYPKIHSAHAWPYIGPFYPYPQVPLGWRKVTLTWDDGWWMLDFKDKGYGPYVTR